MKSGDIRTIVFNSRLVRQIYVNNAWVIRNMFVDYKAIEKGDILGDFIKFTYYNNDIPCIVYCGNEYDFQKLLDRWNHLSKISGNKYIYSYKGEKEKIELKNIPADNNYKIKVYLKDSAVDVQYIM